MFEVLIIFFWHKIPLKVLLVRVQNALVNVDADVGLGCSSVATQVRKGVIVRHHVRLDVLDLSCWVTLQDDDESRL